ncbi:MAG: hypothetical protein AAGD43_21430 [Pseudomonadota bacterium]
MKSLILIALMCLGAASVRAEAMKPECQPDANPDILRIEANSYNSAVVMYFNSEAICSEYLVGDSPHTLTADNGVTVQVTISYPTDTSDNREVITIEPGDDHVAYPPKETLRDGEMRQILIIPKTEQIG